MHKPLPLLTACALLFLLLLSPLQASAKLELPRFLSDGAVLQRDAKWKLWGEAAPGEAIEVRLNGKLLGKTVAQSKRWSLELPAQPAGGPHRIEVRGTNRILLNDVYFGDVWLASGQSNMELPMSRVAVKYPEDIAQAAFPEIRFFRTPKEADFQGPRSDFSSGQWQRVTPQSVAKMSAVAFFFAREIHESQGVPVGIIDNSYGGSAVESWMSEEALEAFPQHLELARRYRDDSYLKGLQEADRKKNEAWYSALDKADRGLAERWFAEQAAGRGWQSIQLPGMWQERGVDMESGVVWFRKEITLPASASQGNALLVLGRLVDADVAYINGVEVGRTTYQYPPRRYEVKPGVLRAGKNTIVVRLVNNQGQGGFVTDKPYFLRAGGKQYDLSGGWQYKVGAKVPPLAGDQYVSYKPPLGFHNALLAPLFPLQLRGVIWYQGETNSGNPDEYARSFPALIRDWRKSFGQGSFPFLYVQLASFLPAHSQPTESQWAATREAQRKALSEPNTAMVVAIDTGEWNDIHPLAKKPLGRRLALAARKLAYGEDIIYSGPMFESMQVRGGQAVLRFEHVGSGLNFDGDRLRGFAIAGEDGRFVWARAKVVGDEVVVHSPRVPHPTRVRYGWADNPDKANLRNKEGLPASPFQARADGT